MKHLEVKKDIFWVGALHPDLRVFDIIMYTPYGTTYNSYVVKGSEKIAVFETVKENFFDQYLERLESLNVNPNNIDYIIVDHTEPDHSGSIGKLLKLSPKAKVVGSMQAINFLKDIINEDFDHIIVGDGDILSLGDKTLQFISAPFLHWPDSIYTYIPEEKTLFTCDSFGSHYSCEEVFNDLIPNKEHYLDALRYYYDCIFGPYKPYVLQAIDKIKDLDINLICPGHGPILRENPLEIVNIYKEWSTPVVPHINGDKKVTICYVSAYGYTKEMAEKIAEGLKSNHNVEVKLYDVIKHEMPEILNDIAISDGILFGSPTIVGDLLVPIRNVLTNLNPVVHGEKYAAAFGSYGWSGESVPRIESRLSELRMKVYGPGLKVKFRSSDDDLKEAFEFGNGFAEALFGEKEIDYTVVGVKHVEEIPVHGKTRYWKCLVCGEIFPSINVPELCIVCGAGSDEFIEVKMEQFGSIDTKDTFVIIGNGAAGFYAAKTIREVNSTCSIKLISNEDVSSYSRPQLSDLLTEDINDDEFYLQTKEWYKENNIEELLNTNVTNINTQNKYITLDNNTTISYDKLILANGSHNFLPPISLISAEDNTIISSLNQMSTENIIGLYSIKTLKDTLRVKKEMKIYKKAIVIGAGPLGLEAAWEMHNAGLDVTVVECLPNLMNNQLDIEGAEIFKDIVKDCGLNFLTSKQCRNIIIKDNKVAGITLNDGDELQCEILLISTGIRSNISLAQNSDITCKKGILVNENMETSIKDIYACGDVAEINGLVYGNWPAAIEMGKTAGANAAGNDRKFTHFTSSIILKALDTEVFSGGLINFNDPSYEQLSSKDLSQRKYTKLFFKDNILVGGIILGNISKAGQVIIGLDNSITKREALLRELL